MSKDSWPYTNRVIQRRYTVGDKKTLTRHKVRRKLEACITHCNNIHQHLAEAAQPFEDADHKAHAGFIRLGEVTEMLKELITSFRANI